MIATDRRSPTSDCRNERDLAREAHVAFAADALVANQSVSISPKHYAT
jgi:hypothetical protein